MKEVRFAMGILLALIGTTTVSLAEPIKLVAKEKHHVLVVLQDNKVIKIEPQSWNKEVIHQCDAGKIIRMATLSQDGNHVALLYLKEKNTVDMNIYIKQLNKNDEPMKIFSSRHISRVFWSIDSKSVYISGLDLNSPRAQVASRHLLWYSKHYQMNTNSLEDTFFGNEFLLLDTVDSGKKFLAVRYGDFLPAMRGVQTPAFAAVATPVHNFHLTEIIPESECLYPMATSNKNDVLIVMNKNQKLCLYRTKDKETTEWPEIKDYNTKSIAFAHDGKHVLVACEPKPNAPSDFKHSLWQYNIDGTEGKKLIEFDSRIQWLESK